MIRTRCLVLGIGNLLLRDEGVGVHVVRALQDVELPEDVELLDGGTGGFHLLGFFQECEYLLIVDATLDGKHPGTVSVSAPRFASDFPRVLSSHDIGLRDLIESATLLGDLPRMFLITVSISADQAMGTELSVPVRAAIGPVVQQVQNIVRDLVGPTAGKPWSDMAISCGNGNA